LGNGLDHGASGTLEHRHNWRSVRSRVRDVGVALVSASVVVLLIGYALAGPSAKLTASVGPVVPRPGTSAFVLGRVLQVDGSGLEGARVEVRSAGRLAGTSVSDRAGSFRVQLHGRCTAYAISLRAEALGATVQTSSRRRLCPGDALPIDAHVVTQGHYLWVPGPR
jgi:hypothetical protein